jgi:hypothetical protein
MLIQTPPAQTFGKGHFARSGPFCILFLTLRGCIRPTSAAHLQIRPKALRGVAAFDMGQLQVASPAKTGEWSGNLPGSCGPRHQPSASMGLKQPRGFAPENLPLGCVLKMLVFCPHITRASSEGRKPV